MSLDRLGLNLSGQPGTNVIEHASRASLGSGPRSALALVRLHPESWRRFRLLVRATLESVWALAQQGRGQTLFVGFHGTHSFADRRVDMLEAKAVDPSRRFGLMREWMRAALARPETRSLAARLPTDLIAFVKSHNEDIAEDRSRWISAAVDFLVEWSRQKPFMLVFSHAHRADEESLELLDSIARAVSTSRIACLVTYRIEAPLSARLTRLMEDLREARLAHSMVIVGPHADEAALHYQSAFGRSMRPESAVASIASDEVAALLHGMAIVEVCRRAGRWSDARTAAERVAAVAQEQRISFIAHAAEIALSQILADQGRWDECLERLERNQTAIENTKEDVLIAWLYWGLARARWGKSDRRRAFQTLRLAQTVAERSSEKVLQASIVLCGVEWLADNRRVRVSRDWLDLIEQMTDQADNLMMSSIFALASGVVALAEGDAVSATGFFRAALRQSTVLGHAYGVARARLRLASALLARDDADSRREGREELVEAHATFTRLGAAADTAATEELGARYGVRPRARRSPSSGSASPGGITPREREVLELLVKGMTNRQIAATLSITEKTAEGHVSNILAKLGVASRGQAAGYAMANGLLEPVEA